MQALPLVTDGTQPSSSTLIRHAVAEGDFGRVRELSDNVFRFSGSWSVATDGVTN